MGNPVPVFNYNGTAYLPVRAISSASGVTIQWDGANNRAYVGKHAGANPAVWLTGVMPTESNIAVSGVLPLEIRLDADSRVGGHVLSLGKVGLWT